MHHSTRGCNSRRKHVAAGHDMLDGALITLHCIHHEWVLVEDSEHGQDGHVSNFHEEDLVFDLVKTNRVLAGMD